MRMHLFKMLDFQKSSLQVRTDNDYIHVHVRIYTCMYIYVHVYVYILYMYIGTLRSGLLEWYVYTCTYIRMYTVCFNCTHCVCVWLYKHTYIYTYVHLYMYTMCG